MHCNNNIVQSTITGYQCVLDRFLGYLASGYRPVCKIKTTRSALLHFQRNNIAIHFTQRHFEKLQYFLQCKTLCHVIFPKTVNPAWYYFLFAALTIYNNDLQFLFTVRHTVLVQSSGCSFSSYDHNTCKRA